KWLRLLGLDTYYLKHGPLTPMPDRVLLTRRTARAGRPRLAGWQRVVRISADRTAGQLDEAASALGLSRADLAPMTRCGVCNHLLASAGPEEVEGRVPEYVMNSQTRFSTCPGCGRIYWPGTHHGRIEAVIESLFGADENA
ncbi:MAG: Mut7-C RNAse domain-containing protein, partial [Proteobacteria bacterium]|nr:Mut7-C RNAse domain-containing protein [Pseudomonadota bacterium]